MNDLLFNFSMQAITPKLMWNNLPTQYKEPAKSYDSFKTIMKKHFSHLNLIE
jgi:hypothetical protein